MSPTYRYTPLSPTSAEIRLLTIHPGPWDTDIECSLEHVSLDAKPTYEALSYTWGDPTNISSILFGRSPWSVRTNLKAALQRLRREDSERVIWIDALCINQDDLDERAEQVPRMFEIYTLAAGVVAWLGEPEADGDPAMEMIQDFASCVDKASKDGRLEDLNPFGDVTTPEDLQKIGFDLSKQDWPALWTFFRRSYWERVWIIQELATCGVSLPSDAETKDRCQIICGPHSIPKRLLDHFCAFLVTVSRSPAFVSLEQIQEPALTLAASGAIPAVGMYLMILQLSEQAASEDGDTRDIAWLMQITRSFKATDPRDKIYALLGLARQKDIVVPDYSKLVDQVFTEFIFRLIQSEQSLNCLMFNRALTNTDQKWPSWIPNPTEDDNDNDGLKPTIPWVLYRMGWYKADGGVGRPLDVELLQTASLGTAPRKILLGVNGIILPLLGRIDRVIGPFLSSNLLSGDEGGQIRDPEAFEKLRTELQAFAQSLPNAKLLETFWRTLVMDGDRISDPANPLTPAPERFREQFMVWADLTLPGPAECGGSDNTSSGSGRHHRDYRDTDSDDDDDDERFQFSSDYYWEKRDKQRDEYYDLLEQMASEFGPNSEMCMAERCFFTTDGGAMGLGPYCVRPGDVVVVLFGASHLIVLRPLEEEEEENGSAATKRYELIGDAYVQGGMHGGYVKHYLDTRKDLSQAERFWLC
ncbi:heterokaryon incompatibility protein-domain-containing protein [Apodospora peruviana]|uniref:Heterokaryon incompatibility protein-domain-containing protein n=1 Tax=Apodospora peruviana TaxID=516989 RepID=A0AAE0LZC6_9PEZI|nr:heterokaryon incompatibility protein-domain-containing protein [Apodospora peruviana]